MCIIVNATALGSSGGLTILKQFVQAIPDDEFKYIIFVNVNVNILFSQTNIRIIKKDVKSNFKRFYWDAFGLKAFLKVNDIKPLATISLQNTNFRTNKSIPNFIYYHQTIPFCDYKWNIFSPNERNLWFYKNIYPFFIRLFLNRNTEIFVQTKFTKVNFMDYFDYPNNKIHVIRPAIEKTTFKKENQIVLDPKQLNLFYPATPFVYKNFKVIFEAINLLRKDLQEKITLYLTCNEIDLIHLNINYETSATIKMMGQISYSEVLDFYNHANALLFPSFLETFGLPLLEAASFGMPIIAADLPYSHEVLGSYQGVSFVKYNNAVLWKDSIEKLFQNKDRKYKPKDIENAESWLCLFNIVKDQIVKNK